MILIEDHKQDTTAVIFSGLTYKTGANHFYDWMKTAQELRVNIIAIKDESYSWYQKTREIISNEIKLAIESIGKDRKLIFIGGSAGGLAALMFSKEFNPDRVVTFCPQSACGKTKRSLGDNRWEELCLKTPDFDLASFDGSNIYPKAIIHYSMNKFDVLHAERINAERQLWAHFEHDLPQEIKRKGILIELLQEEIKKC